MHLDRLSIFDFKNIERADLSFSPNVNCFVGDNGMGKTNVLDAVYYLSFCKSASNPTDAQNIRHGSPFFLLEGTYADVDGTALTVSIGVKPGVKKQLKRGGKPVKRLAEHIGTIPLVLISPSDSLLVSGGSEERRRFLDSAISQYDTAYLDALISYDKALRQRNALLRADEEPDAALLDVLEAMMDSAAAPIYAGRRAFVEEFVPIFRGLYDRLCNASGEVPDIAYATHADRGPLLPLLREGRAKERIVGYSLHGPHKDDLLFSLNGYPLKREGSQGQAKTYFIALKLAQFLFLKQKGERRTPLLLLDDIFDKLDDGRVGQIVEYVSGDDFGQIFITDTHRAHLDQILSHTRRDYRLFVVEEGDVKPAP